jgi:hypothetical protein
MKTGVLGAGFWKNVLVFLGKVNAHGRQDVKIVPENELTRRCVDGA